ncbi:MAG TPA: ABC transporter permease subunit [Gemmatales bacterium]|nr:ABC transporter permease subunit [Gemmatales bacterium]
MLGPIFSREALTVPRHLRHYRARIFYLGTLWVLALTAWQALFGWGQLISQADLAFFGSLAFQLLGYSQLTLVLFFAALIAAGAVAQEKDRRTLVLLLVTDLKHHEIVLGKLIGSLLQIGLLATASVPIMSLFLLLGGVDWRQVLDAYFVLMGTALAAGSVGCLIAFWRDKTFQTLAFTVLILVLYFVAVEGVGLVALPGPVWADAAGSLRAVLNPFRALGRIVAPGADDLSAVSSLPFLLYSLGVTAVLSLVGIVRLRAWNPRGEPIQQPDVETDEEAERKDARRSIHAAPGRVRGVWPNPILFREIRTRAYGQRTLLIKLIYLAVVTLIALSSVRSLPDPQRADRLLPAVGFVPVLVISMLLVNAQAVTSITSERDINSLELLLITDLTPREFLFGKLGGVFWNAKEMILPPVLYLGALSWLGYLGWETLLYLILAVVVLFAFAAMLGIHVALRHVSTRRAILLSIGTIFFLTVGTMLTIYLVLIGGSFETQWTSFVLFLAIGIGGLWMVLGGQEPSLAISIAAWACPLGMFYAITNVIVGNVRTGESGDPLWPFVVVVGAFGFTVAAMLVPLLAEFQVALPHAAAANTE